MSGDDPVIGPVQLGLDGSEIAPLELERRDKGRAGKAPLVNPMLRLYGEFRAPTDDPRTCGSCRFLTARRFSRTYYKCTKRSTSSSATSDHRVGWPACGLYEEDTSG